MTLFRQLVASELRVFENGMLRRLLGRKKAKVTGGWRKLHNEELHILYSSFTTYYYRDQIKDDIAGPYSTHGRYKIYKQNICRET
jgi:hypothetical protein